MPFLLRIFRAASGHKNLVVEHWRDCHNMRNLAQPRVQGLRVRDACCAGFFRQHVDMRGRGQQFR